MNKYIRQYWLSGLPLATLLIAPGVKAEVICNDAQVIGNPNQASPAKDQNKCSDKLPTLEQYATDANLLKKSQNTLIGQTPTNSNKPAPANTPDVEEIDITVTGEKPAQRLIFTPSSAPIYTIPKEQIEKERPNSLADILRSAPGFAVNDVGFGADIHTGTFYRGQSINNSVFLLNGRSIGSNISTYHGATDLNAIPADAIERVELSSGTASTLYGSEAFGGVVNVITKKQIDPPQLNAGVEFGSYGYSRYRVNYGGVAQALSYFLGYERVGADNRYPVPVGAANRGPDGNLFNGDRTVENFYGSFGIKLDDRNNLTLDGYKTTSRRGLLYFGFPLQQDRLDHDLFNIGLKWESRLGNGNDSLLTTSIGFNQDYFGTYGPTQTTFYRTGTLDSKALITRVEHQWQTATNNKLTWGVDFQYNFLNGTVFSTLPSAAAQNELENRNRTRIAIFALDTWNITDNFQLELGLRQNFTNDFGSYLNPSVGTRWNLSPSVALRASFATVQRNPGLDQLYVFDTVHGWLPNSNLQPESGTAYTAGLDINFTDNLTGQFTYFGNSLNNRLGVVSGQWQNIGLVATNGLEAALRWNMSPEFYSFLNYTYTDAKILTGAEQGLQLSTVPYSVGKLGVGYASQGWELNLFLSYFSGARRAIFTTTGTSSLEFSPSYWNLDLSGRIPISKNFALTVYLENLGGNTYEKVNRIYQPGLTYRVGLQATF